MLESKVEKHLRQRVEALGGRAIKLQRLPGWPDRLVIIPRSQDPKVYAGEPIMRFVELKRPKGGVLSRVQKAVHLEITALGCDVIVLSSQSMVDDWIEVVREWQIY